MTNSGGQSEPRWLSVLEQQAWRAYLRASRSLEAVLDCDLQSHGIGLSEYELMSMLSEAPQDRMRMSALADLVVQSRSRVTHTAARLERRGWVVREACLDDRRGVELVLTDAGRAEVEEMARIHVESVRAHFIDLLSTDQVEVITDVMSRVYRSASGTSEDTPIR
ncbi:MAG: MarR family winged helix-turn-helix transcriptional regulator [Nostocoides sp.]